MREAGDAAEGVDKGGIGHEKGVECVLLLCWGALGEEVDYVGYLTLCLKISKVNRCILNSTRSIGGF